MKYTFSLVEEWLSEALQTPPVLCRIPEGTEVKGVSDRLPGQTRKDWIYVLSTEDLASWTGTPLSRMILLAEQDEAAADGAFLDAACLTASSPLFARLLLLQAPNRHL